MKTRLFIDESIAKHPNTGETGFVIVIERGGKRISEEIIFRNSADEVQDYLFTQFPSFEAYLEYREELNRYRTAL